MIGSGPKPICFLQLLHPFQLQRQQILPPPSHLWAPCPAPLPALRFCPLRLSTLPLCPPCPSLVTCPAAPSLSLAGMEKIRAQNERHTGVKSQTVTEGSDNEQNPLVARSTMAWSSAVMCQCVGFGWAWSQKHQMCKPCLLVMPLLSQSTGAPGSGRLGSRCCPSSWTPEECALSLASPLSSGLGSLWM